MRRVLIRSGLALLGLSGLVMAGLYSVGMSPTSLGANIAVGTGMGAKHCSGRFLSGFDDAQIRQDLTLYSAAFDWLSLDIDDRPSVLKWFDGIRGDQCHYREGIGCSLVG